MTHRDYTVETHSPEETERVGEMLSGLVPFGSVVALYGDLAAGKTCFVRGMAVRFVKGEAVTSPTFTIVNEYGDGPTLYHVDLYRLTRLEEIADLGYEELFEPGGVCVIEWAERAGALLPDRRVDVVLEHSGETSRRITISDRGVLPPNWVAMFSSGS